MDKLYFILARTGCSCCRNENHYRGPYIDHGSAERRIRYYKISSGVDAYWPLASQFARRGAYNVVEMSVEFISGNRAIIDNTHVVPSSALVPVIVQDDGTVARNEQERFEYMESPY